MKIETNKRDLEEILDLVGVAKGDGKSDEVVTHIGFHAQDSHVEVTATNGRIGARGSLNCSVEGEGAFTLEYWRLTKWLGTIEDGVVTLEFNTSSAVVTSSHSRILLPSLDPTTFPPFPRFAPTEDAPELEAKRFQGHLTYLREFILEQETMYPQYNHTEVKGGSFWATNQRALVILTIPELSNTHLSIHKLDLKGVLAFVGACGSRPLQIVEREGEDAGFFMVHPGGASLFVPRPRKEFPDLAPQLAILQSGGCVWWEVSPSKLTTAISGLSASADRENHYVSLSTSGSDHLEVSIRSTFGTEDSTAKIPAKIRAKQSSSLPPGKLSFYYPSLLVALNKVKDEVAAIEVFAPLEEGDKKGRGKVTGGMARIVVKSKEGDEIHTLLHWVPR